MYKSLFLKTVIKLTELKKSEDASNTEPHHNQRQMSSYPVLITEILRGLWGKSGVGIKRSKVKISP